MAWVEEVAAMGDSRSLLECEAKDEHVLQLALAVAADFAVIEAKLIVVVEVLETQAAPCFSREDVKRVWCRSEGRSTVGGL